MRNLAAISQSFIYLHIPAVLDFKDVSCFRRPALRLAHA